MFLLWQPHNRGFCNENDTPGGRLTTGRTFGFQEKVFRRFYPETGFSIKQWGGCCRTNPAQTSLVHPSIPCKPEKQCLLLLQSIHFPFKPKLVDNNNDNYRHCCGRTRRSLKESHTWRQTIYDIYIHLLYMKNSPRFFHVRR